LTTEQGYQAQIRTIEQTNTLGSQADRNTAALTSAINAFHNDMTREFCEVREREMSDKIDTLTAANTALRNQIDNANQTAAVAAMLAPIQKEVSDIKAAQPATTTVTYPQLTAVPSYMLYGNGSYYGGYPYFYGGNGSIWA
jgi:phosphoglycerate-specific signal transduction histidine kinase